LRIYSFFLKIKVQIQRSNELEQAITNNENYIKDETLTEELNFTDNLENGIEIEFDEIKTRILISK
jgi:isoleucyl-tRNA synthetase